MFVINVKVEKMDGLLCENNWAIRLTLSKQIVCTYWRDIGKIGSGWWYFDDDWTADAIVHHHFRYFVCWIDVRYIYDVRCGRRGLIIDIIDDVNAMLSSNILCIQEKNVIIERQQQPPQYFLFIYDKSASEMSKYLPNNLVKLYCVWLHAEKRRWSCVECGFHKEQCIVFRHVRTHTTDGTQ